MTRSFIATLAVLLAGGASATAAVPTAAPLLPLTQRDQDKVDEVGCIFAFESGRKTLFYAINSTMTVRTKAGASMCRFPERVFDAFSNAKGSVTCGGQRLGLKPVGKLKSDPAADGSSQSVTLTVGTGRAATVVRGDVSTAC